MTQGAGRGTRTRVVNRNARVMVLGGGGREHALAWALAASPSVAEVLVAPGNPGCSHPGDAARAPISTLPVDDSPADAVTAARKHGIDLVVVGAEGPLCAGVVDALDAAGIAAFGPSQAAAQLEGSKAFMKRLAEKNRIPTAPFIVTSSMREAEAYIRARECQLVVKTDGLAAGKGAIVTSSVDEALAAAEQLLVERRFGAAGANIIIEDRLPGVELSLHVVTDGTRVLLLPVARDHKRINDGDCGPNTGGMGAFAPVSVDADLLERAHREVIEPTLRGMREAGASYRGVLYAGLMVSPEGTPQLLEHNVRFGDPETQVLMPLLNGDIAALLRSAAVGELDRDAATIADERAAAVVVMASAGYPTSSSKGDVITGLESANAVEDAVVYHAGTRRQGEQIVTAGGRVLGVCATAPTPSEARQRAYAAVAHISFPGMQFRNDIAVSA